MADKQEYIVIDKVRVNEKEYHKDSSYAPRFSTFSGKKFVEILANRLMEPARVRRVYA